MIPFLIETFLIAFGAGIFACVYYKILRHDAPHAVQKFMADHETTWWYKPVWDCVCCISGQCGLWSYMLLEVLPGLTITPTGGYHYPALCYISNPMAFFLGLVMSITGSMFTAMLSTKVISMIQKTNSKYA